MTKEQRSQVDGEITALDEVAFRARYALRSLAAQLEAAQVAVAEKDAEIEALKARMEALSQAKE